MTVLIISKNGREFKRQYLKIVHKWNPLLRTRKTRLVPVEQLFNVFRFENDGKFSPQLNDH